MRAGKENRAWSAGPAPSDRAGNAHGKDNDASLREANGKEKPCFLAAALDWASSGIPVFPCRNTPGEDTHKAPHTPSGFHDATTDERTIRAWWGRWPNAYIGMPTGPRSGFDIIDIDRKNGKDGTRAIPGWDALSPIKSFTVSNGIHVWFRADGTLACRNNLFDGVDLKSGGGYIIVPPSEGYCWANGADPSGFHIGKLPYVPEFLRPKRIEREPREPHQDGEAPDIDKLKAALAVIDADDRPTWITVGIALYNELGDAGEDIWLEWSQTSSKWKPKDEKQWLSFARLQGTDNPATLATIFWLANEADPNWYYNWVRARDRELEEFLAAEASADWEGEPSSSSSQEGTKDQGEGADDDPPPEDEPEAKADGAGPKGQEQKTEPPKVKRFFTSGDFIGGYVPPDYVLDGIIQRGFLYALTGKSNSGKTAILHRLAAQAAMGTALCGHEIEKTKVLYLAGENPDDHRMRFILLCDELKLDPTALNILWLPFRADLSGKPFKKALEDQDAAHGPFGLIIADTSQAYFQGKDENDNPQMLEHAKMFRDLIALLPSRPAVVVSCHPTKNGDKLVPRGGSSFFNEIDTNLCVDKREHTTVANLHWVEKIRGVDFPPLPFELRTGQTEHLKDAKGRKIWSIVAVPISEATATGLEETNEARAMQVLSLLVEDVGMSLAAIAERLDWSYPNGEPNKSLVQRLVNSLADQRMIEKGPPRRVMPKGQRAVAGYTPPAPAPANRGRPGDDWW